MIINIGANKAVSYASREINIPNIEPVPMVSIKRHTKAKVPAVLVNLLNGLSSIVHK